MLCDRLRNANKSEYISPCLAPLVHNADLSSFCRFYKLPASFIKKVRQFNSSIRETFHKSWDMSMKERSCEQKLASKFFLQFSLKKWFTRKFCEAITCKYHKNSKNNQFNLFLLDWEREKAKKGPEYPSIITKVTREFFSTPKHGVTYTLNNHS